MVSNFFRAARGNLSTMGGRACGDATRRRSLNRDAGLGSIGLLGPADAADAAGPYSPSEWFAVEADVHEEVVTQEIAAEQQGILLCSAGR